MRRLVAALSCLIYAGIALESSPETWAEALEEKRARPAVVVVCPNAWQPALEKWAAYRSQDYRLTILDSHRDPSALRQRIIEKAGEAGSLEAVVLCGDVFQDITTDAKLPPIRETIVPTFVLPTTVKLGEGQTPTLASDNPFSDLDGDGSPDVAVGRVPAKSAEDLKRMLDRVIHYEHSSDFSEWRDRVHVTAGVGGFGLFADKAIETVARRYLSEGIPDRFRLQMTYASLHSPYCPDPRSLKQTFLGKLNRGGLFWVYIGHGWIDSLDDFHYDNSEECICSREDTELFDAPVGPPVAVLLACYTGAFDAKVDCFAERLLHQPNGPIAIVAGSRVTMPYGLSQFAGEMMDTCFVQNESRLGRVVLQAKKSIWTDEKESEKRSEPASVSSSKLKSKYQSAIEAMATALSPVGHDLVAERREHVRLMNLLGDPLLVIRHPQPLKIEARDTIEAGEPLDAEIEAPWSGTMEVELLLHRDRLPSTLESIQANEQAEARYQRMQQNYDRANHLVLAHQRLDVEAGTRHVLFETKEDFRGQYVLRARMQGEEDWAIGTKRVQFQRKKKAN
ncbi:Gingipain R2 precursor [Pirellula sp. SH-Sr6A]|uniref:C25 family cysteine peptidase n=1 Tax=Pirellula sp. SH-Sr6A TaxID=1632865 RepID=UPI00078D274F|nr:C25 family cysteine peptidase [Pirellula sp. SH-Sr6A]AMV32310.1 Gingipain R2 precursor [Pirellula sp. SH-Sr6A]